MTHPTPPADRGAEVLTAEPAVGTETRDELIARALKAEQSLALAVEEFRWIAMFAKVRAADDSKTFARVGRDALRNIEVRAREVHSKLTEAE